MLSVYQSITEVTTGLIKTVKDVTNGRAKYDVIGLIGEESAFGEELDDSRKKRCYYEHRNTETK